MTDRWFSEGELEQLSRPTMDRAVEAIDAGELDAARRLCGEMKHDLWSELVEHRARRRSIEQIQLTNLGPWQRILRLAVQTKDVVASGCEVALPPSEEIGGFRVGRKAFHGRDRHRAACGARKGPSCARCPDRVRPTAAIAALAPAPHGARNATGRNVVAL